jgi:hypothetical protein
MDCPLTSLSHSGLACGLNRTFSKPFFFPLNEFDGYFRKKIQKDYLFEKADRRNELKSSNSA